jgi:hypothetical protein
MQDVFGMGEALLAAQAVSKASVQRYSPALRPRRDFDATPAASTRRKRRDGRVHRHLPGATSARSLASN